MVCVFDYVNSVRFYDRVVHSKQLNVSHDWLAYGGDDDVVSFHLEKHKN